MDGLKNLFLKLTPIIFLICCICYGILHTFSSNEESNITYLHTQYVNTETYEPYVNPTDEQKEQALKVYKFDMVSYTQNIDQNILVRSVQKTFNLQNYNNIIESYEVIWQDGYQIGDILKTLLNSVILVLDSIIFPINIILIPLRITAGLILTGMSIIGININKGTAIIPFLNTITDEASIPLINGLYSKEDAQNIIDTTWYLKTEPESKYYKTLTTVVAGQLNKIYVDYDIDLQIQPNIQAGGQYVVYGGIRTEYKIENNVWHFKIFYKSARGVNEKLIYDNGYVVADEYREITFLQRFNYEDSEEIKEMLKFLYANANQIS